MHEVCTLDTSCANFSLAPRAPISDNPALIDCSGARAEDLRSIAQGCQGQEGSPARDDPEFLKTIDGILKIAIHSFCTSVEIA